MLRPKTITKREKKKSFNKRLGTGLVVLGLSLIAFCLLLTDISEKNLNLLSPLSKNQESTLLALKSELKEKKIKYQTIESQSDLSYLVRLTPKSEVIIDPKKDISSQLSSLQLISSQLKIEGKAFSRLDFRYQKPVISF